MLSILCCICFVLYSSSLLSPSFYHCLCSCILSCMLLFSLLCLDVHVYVSPSLSCVYSSRCLWCPCIWHTIALNTLILCPWIHDIHLLSCAFYCDGYFIWYALPGRREWCNEGESCVEKFIQWSARQRKQGKSRVSALGTMGKWLDGWLLVTWTYMHHTSSLTCHG